MGTDAVAEDAELAAGDFTAIKELEGAGGGVAWVGKGCFFGGDTFFVDAIEGFACKINFTPNFDEG